MPFPDSMLNYAAPAWNDFPDIDLYMDQVISVLERYLAPLSGDKGITSTMINNYVKQKMILPPQNKKYSREQLSRLFMICILKRFMQLSDITKLLENLYSGRNAEDAYSVFRDELDSSVRVTFAAGKKQSAPESDPTLEALRCALLAFAAICYSQGAFQSACRTWEEKEQTEEKSEEKKKK